MATHSSILAWRIPGMGKPGGLPSCLWRCAESDTTKATWQQQQVGHNFPSKEQASFNFMAAVTICSDFETPKIKSLPVSTVSLPISHEVVGPSGVRECIYVSLISQFFPPPFPSLVPICLFSPVDFKRCPSIHSIVICIFQSLFL